MNVLQIELLRWLDRLTTQSFTNNTVTTDLSPSTCRPHDYNRPLAFLVADINDMHAELYFGLTIMVCRCFLRQNPRDLSLLNTSSLVFCAKFVDFLTWRHWYSPDTIPCIYMYLIFSIHVPPSKS